MTDIASDSAAAHVLVSDFDGTMTRHDFYKLAIEKLLPADTPNHWDDYRAGTITHFEALRRYFAAIRTREAVVFDVVEQMELDPNLRSAVDALHSAGWQVVITSAGCDWYIRRLLAAAGVDITVYSNPGRFAEHCGLIMEMPEDSPYLSATLGVDKTAVVRDFIRQGAEVAFAGDGFPDADPARLVPAHRRFARGDLADVLRQETLEFLPFDSWSDIARAIVPHRD